MEGSKRKRDESEDSTRSIALDFNIHTLKRLQLGTVRITGILPDGSTISSADFKISNIEEVCNILKAFPCSSKKTPVPNTDIPHDFTTRKKDEPVPVSGTDAPMDLTKKEPEPDYFDELFTQEDKPPSPANKYEIHESSPGPDEGHDKNRVTKYIICPGKINEQELHMLRTLAFRFKGLKYYEKYGPSVTHVISGVEFGKLPISMHVMQALCDNKRVITTAWLVACMERENIVDTTPFETYTCGLSFSSNGQRPYMDKIFRGYSFKFRTGLKSKFEGITAPEWIMIVESLGGNVIRGNVHTETVDFLIADPTNKSVAFPSMTFKHRKDVTWIFNCICEFRVRI